MKVIPIKHLLLRLFVIVAASFLYAGLFKITYGLIHNTVAVTVLNLVFIIIIAWYWGKTSGILMAAANTFWTATVLRFASPEDFKDPIDALFGIFIQVAIAVVTGMAGSLTRTLRSEIETRTAAENKLKEYQNRLEEMVQQRTAELKTANERLRQAEKMEAIGQLAGGVAHDFNNQLTIIMGYCELLFSTLDKSSAQFDFVKQIDKSGKHAADLTRQLLSFARKDVYKSKVVDINECAREIVTLISRSLKNIKIVLNLHAQNPHVWGGPTQLQNALLNLALNARDAMEQKGGELIITTENVVLDTTTDIINDHNLPLGTYVAVSVKDSGTGIDPEHLKHIFEPFFTTKEEGKGTGMGLAAVYGIVSRHKGGIKVESWLGIGSMFTLLFPVTKYVVQDAMDERLPIKKPDGNAHILIIDDEQDVATLMSDMLEAIGYTVSVVLSGKEAVEMYATTGKETSLVIIDLVMPGMNGNETYHALKKINPEIKAIISSGYAFQRDIDDLIKDGAKVFLQKPFSMNELADLIQIALSERG
jgi:signal transduction histidine kinase/ActR/RegA family two-component response regulator